MLRAHIFAARFSLRKAKYQVSHVIWLMSSTVRVHPALYLLYYTSILYYTLIKKFMYHNIFCIELHVFSCEINFSRYDTQGYTEETNFIAQFIRRRFTKLTVLILIWYFFYTASFISFVLGAIREIFYFVIALLLKFGTIYLRFYMKNNTNYFHQNNK